MSELGTLLGELERVAGARPVPVVDRDTDNRLVQVRLGTASSLFAALQCKHAATAAHALRVALSCSAWAARMGLDRQQRDVIEIAALLHDVGVIGVPDHVLLKPAKLDADEAAMMEQSWQMSLQILRRSCASDEVLDVVEHVPARFDGTRNGFRFRGTQIPLAARMIAIAEAFDAMTVDHVYRTAMSQERAKVELFDCAGTQFDPDLVRQFAEFHVDNQTELHREAAGQWLQSLASESGNAYWQLNDRPAAADRPSAESLFQSKLLENMHDAVVFIDTAGRVTLWNRGTERLTGIAGGSVRQRHWHPGLLKMADEKGQPVSQADCPVRTAIRSGAQSLRRLTISGRTGRSVTVDTHAIPVVGEDAVTLGAILLFHDASSETSLEQRCQNLHEKATKDPLTQVANRAEFDRVHELFVAAHQKQQVPCSLIIGDLDRFKKVNDTYGHQAGDEVIKSLATLLKRSCGAGDLVARYGGEEFVVLCADCDNATATRRAEDIRKALAQVSQPTMKGRKVTVSFGVTEIQPGDTPETMLRRADRGLLMAKAQGRNTVVQLGTGSERAELPKTSSGAKKKKEAKPKHLLTRTLVTPVPIKMAIEKLRGFVADHQAKILKIDGNRVRMEIIDGYQGPMRRRADRPMAFAVELQFSEERVCKQRGDESSAETSSTCAASADGVARTKIQLSVRPKKNRDRRRTDLDSRVREVVVSFRSYLMAVEADTEPRCETQTAKRRFLTPWLKK